MESNLESFCEVSPCSNPIAQALARHQWYDKELFMTSGKSGNLGTSSECLSFPQMDGISFHAFDKWKLQ